MTAILALPELAIPCAIESNQDWLDSIAFTDVNGNPVAIDGIAFRLQARATATGADVFLDASTDDGRLAIVSAGALASVLTRGGGYAIGDLVYPAGGTGITPATLVVTALALAGLALGVAGSGYAAGDTIPLSGGIASAPAVVTVDAVDGSSRITAFHVSSSGSYTVAPTTFAQGSTSGAGSGATFVSPAWGVAAARMKTAGTYMALPANPVAQGATSGLGAGATFALTWVNNALSIQVPAADLEASLIGAAEVYQIQAQADGYTQNVVSGPLTVSPGVVR